VWVKLEAGVAFINCHLKHLFSTVAFSNQRVLVLPCHVLKRELAHLGSLNEPEFQPKGDVINSRSVVSLNPKQFPVAPHKFPCFQHCALGGFGQHLRWHKPACESAHLVGVVCVLSGAVADMLVPV